MKWIPKYQRAGSINKEWVRDRDINGNWGYRNFKTGQFRATVPNSQEERQQEQRKNNTAALKQYSADSVKYNHERATRKNHSDETVKKVISKPSLVMRNNGKTTIVRSKELAPGEDSAKLNTTIEEQIPMFKGLNLVTGLGKLALSKMGQNEFSHWARNSLLNETAGNLTKNIATPLIESEAVPLEDGFVYRTFTPSHGGWVKDGGVYNRSYGIGDVKVKGGKYYSVRQAHFNNPDKLWWDKFGHNRGQVVQVINEANTQSLQDAAKNGFNLNYGYFEKGYRLSDPIKIDEVITYKKDPISNTMVPSMPGKIITNKQSLLEIFDAPGIQLNNTGFKGNTSLKFFERPVKLTKAEKLGVPKADRNNVNFNKSLQTPHTFTQPYLNNLGEYNFSNDAVDNPIFGKYIGDGSEQIVYEDALSPGKVLKIYNDIGHSSYSSLRNFVTQYQKRNNIPYQLPTSFEGFVTSNNKMYPVFSQQYAPSISEVEFPDAISALRTQLKGYSESTPEVFERQGRQILDLQPGNISRLKNKYYFIDAFPEGFKQGGKLSKNLKVNEIVFN